MAKGYWIVNNVINDETGYEAYKFAAAKALGKFGAKFVVRAGKQDLREGVMHPRAIVIEFASYADAVACYESAEYQAAKALRLPVADGNLAIVEGFDG